MHGELGKRSYLQGYCTVQIMVAQAIPGSRWKFVTVFFVFSAADLVKKFAVKKCSILISIFILIFSMIFIVISSGAKAESQSDAKKDLVSILHIRAVSLLGQDNDSEDRKDRGKKPLQEISVGLKEGLNTFFDFTSPADQGLTPRDDSRTDFRGVFGFYIGFK
jgi:hypothetical protein